MDIELTGPIIAKSTKRHIAYAAVLVPGEPDHDGDVLKAEKIEKVAHEWLGNYGNVDLQHSLNNIAVPVESYITTENRDVSVKGQTVVLPKGTWVLASRIDDADTWDRVEKGELTGYSIMGVPGAALKSKEIAFKRTMLADLGDDWVAPFVSVVDEPAVPKAKFFALKAKGGDNGFFARLFKSKEEREMEEIEKKLEEAQKEHDDKLKSLSETVEALTGEVQALKEVPVLEELEEETPDPAEAIKAEMQEKIDAAHKEIADLKEQVETLAKKRSPERVIKGQDDDETESEGPSFEGRDGYGRARPEDK